MRVSRIVAAASIALSIPVGAQAPEAPQASRWTPALFDLWTKVRTGTGAPVYWYSVGTLRSYPDGKLLARVEGYDAARAERVSPTMAHQYNRKIYIYRDPATNAVITTGNGKPVEPVAYPYQFITYELKDGTVETWVEQGKGKRIQRIGPSRDIDVRRIGDGVVFTAPVYLDFATPSGSRYQAFENYDFVVPTPYRPGAINKLSWVRYGDAPGFAGGGKAIMHLVTWRIDRYSALPRTMRDYIEANAPLWKAPPASLADIRKLQAD